MPGRRAGQHARETTRRNARGFLVLLALLWVAAAVIVMAVGVSRIEVIGSVPPLLIVAMLLLDRFAVPVVERWGRGAAGEEHVGRLLEDLEGAGWLTIHDVDTGRGNIDTIAIGPGGLFTIEVKSHGRALRADRVDAPMLGQAYAQKKWLERVAGRPVTALLVFSRAYLIGKPVSRQRGVVVLSARMLAGHLRRYPAALSAQEARRLHDRLGYALGA